MSICLWWRIFSPILERKDSDTILSEEVLLDQRYSESGEMEEIEEQREWKLRLAIEISALVGLAFGLAGLVVFCYRGIGMRGSLGGIGLDGLVH